MEQDADIPGLGARRAALNLVTAVTEEQRLLSEVMPKGLAPLSPPDRARAQRLATETLRWASRSDRVLGPYLRKKPWPRTHDALRMGVWEMLADGAAAHGVVNSVVALLQETEQTRGQAGLANAVLRKVAGNPVDWSALPLPQLPKWLRKPLIADYGKAAVAGMEATHAAAAPLDLTPAPDAPSDLAAQLGANAGPFGTLRLSEAGQVSALPGYDEGWWWVQDAAAALPVRALAPLPGERVLDLCAAPGGKTLQIAAAKAEVTALDVSEGRMARVKENLSRMRMNADLVVADALAWAPDDVFDAVLLDAPCSATGTIRRHPDLPFAKDGSQFPTLFALQIALIDRAWAFLRPGGRMVYCTCSLLIDEGEEQVRDALGRHADMSVDTSPLALPGIDPSWITAEGLRLRPDYAAPAGGMDGFFMTVLRKAA